MGHEALRKEDTVKKEEKKEEEKKKKQGIRGVCGVNDSLPGCPVLKANYVRSNPGTGVTGRSSFFVEPTPLGRRGNKGESFFFFFFEKWAKFILGHSRPSRSPLPSISKSR